jgi:hypothetical protein
MERFQATLMRDNKVYLHSLVGTFTAPERAAGFFAAPERTSLVARSSYQLILADGQALSIAITKAHRLAIVMFAVT